MENNNKHIDKKLVSKFKSCRLLVLDFDGVLTDNKVYVDENGKEMVMCDRGDGLGIELLKQKTDIGIVIISKEKNKVVAMRAQKIGVECMQGVDDKLSIIKRYIAKKGLSVKEVCFVGNDVNDIECLKNVGLSVAVRDSHSEVLKNVDYITLADGGRGAVREICDKIINS